MKSISNFLSLLIILLLATNLAHGKTITLKLATLKDGGHQYYFELLEKSLTADGYKVTIESQNNVPQKRVLALLSGGELTLHWFVKNNAKDKEYTPVEVGVTNSLIGHRILFIQKGSQSKYDGVQTLPDFRNLNLVGGFGKNWFDVKVWKENDLKYLEKDGNWRLIYKMVRKGGRGYDYFSRGMIEILPESKTYPYLEIEKRLVLIYERDFQFYLGQGSESMKPILIQALENAKKSGLMQQLIRKHWAEDFEKLNFDERIKIKLKTPA